MDVHANSILANTTWVKRPNALLVPSTLALHSFCRRLLAKVHKKLVDPNQRLMTAWGETSFGTIMKNFKKTGFSKALDGTKDDVLWCCNEWTLAPIVATSEVNKCRQ